MYIGHLLGPSVNVCSSCSAKVASPPAGCSLLYPFLAEISLDLHDRKSCFNLIEWVSQSALSTIKIPSSLLQCCEEFTSGKLVATSQVGRFVNTFINDPQSLLSDLVLLDAWNMTLDHCDCLNKGLEYLFTVEELVLGTQDPQHIHRYDEMFENVPWSSEIKRLRMEHVTLGLTELDWLSAQAWSHLRVLMLDSLQTSPLTSDREQFPTMTGFPESRLAMDIALRRLANLRVVVLGAFEFWIHPASTPVVLYLAEARRHPVYRAEVKSWLTVHDRSFLDGDVPYIHMKGRMAQEPLADAARLFNYVVLRRVSWE